MHSILHTDNGDRFTDYVNTVADSWILPQNALIDEERRTKQSYQSVRISFTQFGYNILSDCPFKMTFFVKIWK